MADSKITALASISTSTDPAVDPLIIVDVSDTSMAASGTSKKVTLNNLLSSSPTATGAFTVSGLVTAGSTTITGAATVGTTLGVTGNLTVGTNALIVFPATNRVLINQTAAIQGDSLEISAKSDGGTISLFGRASDNGSTLTFRASTTVTPKASFTANDTGLSIRTGTVERYNIDATGISTWSVAGTTAMTLNSTGLGVGVTPSLEKLQVNGGIVLSPPATPATLATNGQLTVNATSNTNLRFSYRGSDGTTRVANLTLA